MGTNPYTAGVFYTGEFITEEFVETFSELGVDRRVAVLAEISARPECSQLIIRHNHTNTVTIEALNTVYTYFHVNASGTLVGGKTPTQFANRTDAYLNAHVPSYLIFTDQNLVNRYVTATPNNTLVASGTQPTFPIQDAQFVGAYLEWVGADGTSIYRMTVNSSNQIALTLHRTEPHRILPIRISNGHPFAFDGTSLFIEGLVSMDDIHMEISQYGGGYSGVVEPRIGAVHLQLSDSWFDYLIEQSWDTRDITIRIGLTDQDMGTYRVVLRGKTERAEANLDRLTITLRDETILFDRTLQENSYKGTGGYEGGPDLVGVQKPLTYGFVRHASPILVDEALSLYQVHEGGIHSIFSVHTGGILQPHLGGLPSGHSDLTTWVPSASEVNAAGWRRHYSRGFFRLAVPPVAPVTVSFWGDTAVPTATSRIGEIIRVMIQKRIPELTIDQNSFDAFHGEQVGGAGIYITGSKSIREIFHDLVAPVGAMISVNALNVVKIGRVRTRQPVAFLGEHNLLEDSQPSRRQPPRAGAIVRVGYFKNWTLFNETDFLNTFGINVRIFLQRDQSWKEMIWYGGANARLPVSASAPTVEYPTLLDNAENTSRLAAFLAFRDHSLQNLYQVTAIGFGFQIEVGDTVLLQYEKLRLQNVKTGIVVAVTEKSPTSSQEDLTELLIWA